MSDTLKAAIQLTFVDLAFRGIERLKGRMQGLAAASEETRRSFDRTVKSAKFAAVSAIVTRQLAGGLKKAVLPASDLQAELLGTRAELSRAGKDAGILAQEMAKVKKTAFEVQAWTPFDQGQIVALEKALVKSGGAIESVTGTKGAASAAATLATYEEANPEEMGKALIGIGTPFKIAADGYMGLADSISRAASASTVGAVDIAQSAKYAAGPMAELGKSTDEMLALTAVMAQVGVVGTQAGTSLKNFFLKAARNRMFRDAKGDLKSTAEIIEILRKRYGDLGSGKRIEKLNRLFGEEGLPVAIALLNKGRGSYEDINRAMGESITLQEKIALQMMGFGKQWESLKGTARSTIQTLYQPALEPLTWIIRKTNDLTAAIGRAANESEWLGKTVSGAHVGLTVLGGAATLGLAGAALVYARRTLKGVGGFRGLFSAAGGSVAGIATGKAVQAATGVTPVFVTNWPAGGIGGGVAGGLAAEAGARRITKAVSGFVGTYGLGATLGWGAVAAAAGAAIGTGMNAGFSAWIRQLTNGEIRDFGELFHEMTEIRKQNMAREEQRPADEAAYQAAVLGYDLWQTGKTDKEQDETWARLLAESEAEQRRMDPAFMGYGLPEDILEFWRNGTPSTGSERPIENHVELNIQIDRENRVYTQTGLGTNAEVNVNGGGLP